MYTVQKEPSIFTSYNVSGEYLVSVRVLYIVSEVCSEWMCEKLFVYVFLYAVQSMTPHTGCMIVLQN